MEMIDLSSLPKEDRDKIMDILNNSVKNDSLDKIKNEYLESLKNIKKSEEYDEFDYDVKDSFYDSAITGSDISDRKAKGLLTKDENETYQQLEKIRESGTPGNFWNNVKNVLSAKQEVDISTVNDVIDPELLK